MAWVAADRAVKAVEQHDLDGPAERWRQLRADIRAEVCARGYDPDRATFTQSYGRPELDASLLMLPLVGFCDANDPRMIGTVAAIERELMVDGFVRRYGEGSLGDIDGLPGSEGAFLPCSFWLAECLVRGGSRDAGLEVFEAAAATANDLGLFAEEFDPATGEMLGNFPQGLTHLSYISAAIALWWEPT